MEYRKVIGIILLGIAGTAIVAGQEDITEALLPAIIFSIVGLVLLVKKPKTKEEKQKKIEEIQRIKESIWQREYYKENHMTAKHQAGLPLATGTVCKVGYEEDFFCFEGGGNSFNLICNRITDVCIITDIEIQKQYVSSIGGAITGASLFGSLGASIGGRAKIKKITTEMEYLIFTYLKEGEIDYISFELMHIDVNKAERWIVMFKQNNLKMQGKSIDL